MKTIFKQSICLITISLLFVACGSKSKVVTTKKSPKKVEQTQPQQPVVTQPPVVQQPKPPVVQHPKEPKTTTPVFKDKVSAYIHQFKDVAMTEMKLYRIPASITLAQGILESASGKGRLAREANNHFGIKCHTSWKGERIYHDDDSLQECFRKYVDASYSYRDHSLFLTQRSRYKSLFQLAPDDYKGWARGLRKAGYATDTKYPQKLISLIERYDLDTYDAFVLENNELPTSSHQANVMIQHVVAPGETLYRISNKYGMSVGEIKELNNLRTDVLQVGKVLKIKTNKN